MQFEFDGRKYRIGFHHEPPVEWAAHVNHEVTLSHRDVTDCDGSGPVVLVCVTCTQRGRWGKTEVGENRDVIISHRDPVRRTYAVILRLDPASGSWDLVGVGRAVPNLDAGDHFCKETGRLHALRRAIEARDKLFPEPDEGKKAFHAAAWAAYVYRKQQAALRKA